MSITKHVVSMPLVCFPVNKLKSSNNMARVGQDLTLFAFKIFLVLTELLGGQATDT